MLTAEQFALALRMTESNNNPRAYGDGGLVLTSYQVHPAWVWDKVRRYQVMPKVDESWESWIGRLVMAFYTGKVQSSDASSLAMWFHLGHFTIPSEPDWDAVYAARFAECVDAIVTGRLSNA